MRRQILLRDIKSVRVRNFNFDSDDAYSRADIDVGAQAAQRPGLERAGAGPQARAQEHVDVYLNMAEGKIMGLAVIASEPREFTIVNIVGSIDIDKLAKLEGQFGIPRVSRIRAREFRKPSAQIRRSLLRHARAGDATAFAALVRTHQGSVFSIGLRMLNRRDAAEDLAQDVFLQLYRKLDSIESLEHLGFWLRRVAVEPGHRLAAARGLQHHPAARRRRRGRRRRRPSPTR